MSPCSDPKCGGVCQDPTADRQAREEILRTCRMLHDKGYLAANDGNVSVRLCKRRVLVTPTGVAKAFLEPDDLIVVDMEGQQLSGAGTPSGELAMHLHALSVRPDAKAVVHAHPPICIALTLHRHLRLNDVLPEVILSLGRIEVVPYARPLTEALARAAAEALQGADGVLLARHGTVTVGRSLAHAYAATERLEHAAHVLWVAYTLGRPTALPDHEARRLHDMYAIARGHPD